VAFLLPAFSIGSKMAADFSSLTFHNPQHCSKIKIKAIKRRSLA